MFITNKSFWQSIGNGIEYLLLGIRDGVAWVFTGLATTLTTIVLALWNGWLWCLSESRPLRFFALIFVLIIGGALAYINTRGAWLRTGDIGYTILIGGIEGILLIALPLVFVVNGWFNKTVSLIIFVSSLVIASFNAEPAIEEIITKGKSINIQENERRADKLREEVFGFEDPETGERIEGSGLLDRAKTLEEDARRARDERGHTTASKTVDESAENIRNQISEKLAEAERLDAEAAKATFYRWMALLTFIAAELIRSAGLKALLGMGKKPTTPKPSTTPNEDTVTISADEYADLKQREENAKEGAKKAAKTRRQGNKIEQSREYMAARIRELDEWLKAGGTADQFAASKGMSLPHLKMTMQGHLTRERYEELFGSHEVIVPETEKEGADDEGIEPKVA